MQVFEDLFELLEGDISILINVIFIKYLLQLALAYLVTQLLHGPRDIFGRDFALLLRVELVENCEQAILSQDALNLDGR